jgi:hypothetical protein
MVQNWLHLGQQLNVLNRKYTDLDFDEVKQNPEYNILAREFLNGKKVEFMKDVEKATVKLFTQKESVSMLKGSKNGKTLVECLFAYEGNQEEATKLFEEIQEEQKTRYSSRSSYGGGKRRGRSGQTIL